MSKQHSILPHGQLEEIAPGIWQVRGSLARVPLPRNMIIYPMKDGGLLIHSAVALNEEGMAQLEALGKPSVMIVPNSYHRLDAPFYKARYPEIRVVCPARARTQVEKVVPVDGSAEELQLPGVTPIQPEGIKRVELLYELETTKGRALIVCDLLFNLPVGRGIGGLIGRLMGSAGFFGMTRIARMLMLKDRQVFKAWLEQLAKRNDIALISMAHGKPITENCSARLMEAAARL